MKRFFIAIIVVFTAFSGFAQQDTDQNLAFQFYRDGEYDKAAQLFERLYNKNPESDVYYRYLFNSLLYIKAYEPLEKIVEKKIKKSDEPLTYQVDLGYMYIQKGNLSKGKDEYKDAIKALPAEERQIVQVANGFENYRETEMAVETYEKGQKLLGDEYRFTLDLAKLYEKLNEPKESIENYLKTIDRNPSNAQDIQNQLQTTIQKKEYAEEFQKQLLTRVQRAPEITAYPELLIWFYIQRGNFTSAAIQAKALDRRLDENGYRLMNLGRAALKAEKYDAAEEAYEYVIKKGKQHPFYMRAKQELLQVQRDKIVNTLDYTQEDITKLDRQYDAFIEEFGVNRNTASTIREKAQLKAFYLNDYDEAIALLEELLNYPQIDKHLKGEFKLELGDFYIMKGEIWEAALLYTQVDKAFKDEPLGEMARYKNAKLSYYKGEFEWAQAQLDVLKASTSELIANDALDLSVFIMDNLGLDTTLYPMEKFARADLLFYQNKLDQALTALDSIRINYPDHGLTDDIYYTKAEIYLKKQDIETAAQYLQKVIDEYADDLLGDDATFKLAQLYEDELNNKDKAMELYQTLIFNYKDSVYIVEARKRFRALRGDQL